jgi:hypothetical protein
MKEIKKEKNIFYYSEHIDEDSINTFLKNDLIKTLPKDYLWFLEVCSGGKLKNIDSEDYRSAIEITFPDGEPYCIDELHDPSEKNMFGGAVILEQSKHINEIYKEEMGGKNNGFMFASAFGLEYIFIYPDGEIRYLHSDLELFTVLATSFTSFLKLIIDSCDGYVENLSEIYEEMIKLGFK